MKKIALFLILIGSLSANESIINLEQSCEKVEAGACYSLGLELYEGESKNRDYSRAKEIFETSCDAGYFKGCYSLAQMYLDSYSIPNINSKQEIKNALDKGIELYTKACKGGDALSCNELAQIYIDGDRLDEDFEKGFAFAKMACEHKDGDACFTIGGFYTFGVGVDVDIQKALEYLKKACDLGVEEGCDNYEGRGEVPIPK